MQLGQAAVQNHNFSEASAWFTKALAENPKDPQIRACLGQSLCWLGNRDEGKALLRQSGQLLLKKARKSRDIRMVLDLAEQLQYWNDYPGALEICQTAVKINQNVARGFQLLSLICSRLNQTKPALTAGRQALRLAPNNANMAFNLALLESAAGLLAEAKRRLSLILQDSTLILENQFKAHKELARIHDKLGEYDQVFTHLQVATESSQSLPEVRRQDPGLVPRMLEIYKLGFDRPLLNRWSAHPFPKEQPVPVFLLGFMRTGTTLTQEVLGAHTGVFVADEANLIISVVKELDRMSNHQGDVVTQLNKLDWEGVLHLRNCYWNRARALYGDAVGARLFLDKTTMNTIDVGLINCLFPDAKVVFLLRDPRDVCLSCVLQTMQPTPSTVHLLSLQGTVRFYSQVMDWWLTIKPQLSLQFIELRYEEAVSQFEPTFRRIFQFLDLTWDPAVADFHNQAARKFIASPSFNQVVKPLYSSSVGRWRHYQTEFSAIADILQPYVNAFGYPD